MPQVLSEVVPADQPWILFDKDWKISYRGTKEQCESFIAQVRANGKTDTFCLYEPVACYSAVLDSVIDWQKP